MTVRRHVFTVNTDGELQFTRNTEIEQMLGTHGEMVRVTEIEKSIGRKGMYLIHWLRGPFAPRYHNIDDHNKYWPRLTMPNMPFIVDDRTGMFYFYTYEEGNAYEVEFINHMRRAGVQLT